MFFCPPAACVDAGKLENTDVHLANVYKYMVLIFFDRLTFF